VNAKGARRLGGDQAGPFGLALFLLPLFVFVNGMFRHEVPSHALPILTRSTCSASLIAHSAELLYNQRSSVSVRN
jgi:hypothetical protein